MLKTQLLLTLITGCILTCQTQVAHAYFTSQASITVKNTTIIGTIANAGDDDGSGCDALDPDAPPPTPGTEGDDTCTEIPEE